MAGLADRVDELRRLVRTDSNPRVRRRVHAVRMPAQGASKLSNHRWWADLPALERATGVLLAALRAEFHRPGRGIRLVQDFSNVG